MICTGTANVCRCVCVYMYVCIYTCVHVHMYLCMRADICMYERTYVYALKYVREYPNESVRTCMYLCARISVNTSMCITFVSVYLYNQVVCSYVYMCASPGPHVS